MSQFYVIFEDLTTEFPEDVGPLAKLEAFLSESGGTSRAAPVLGIDRLFDVASPVSLGRLSNLLSALVREGVLEELVRVEPEGRGVLGTFSSLDQVPDRLPDPRRDEEAVEITPDDIRLYYRIVK